MSKFDLTVDKITESITIGSMDKILKPKTMRAIRTAHILVDVSKSLNLTKTICEIIDGGGRDKEVMSFLYGIGLPESH